MANRISVQFAEKLSQGKRLFIAYITAGCPDREGSVAVALELAALGVDAIELGIPFSDPYGDGVVNVEAALKAISQGFSMDDYFAVAAAVREKSEVPLVAFGYVNPVAHMGYDTFARRAAEAGLDGALIVDLPVEESQEFETALSAHGLTNTFLTAPTSTPKRLDRICQKAGGFLYHVSRTGVTGEKSDLSPTLKSEVDGLRTRTRIPVVVGFGLNTPEQISKVCSFADGVVVGSAIVRRTLQAKPLPEILSDVRALVAPLREAARG